MLKIAITGNIAAGKSTIEELLIQKNFNVLDTDAIAHDLLKNKTVKQHIIKEFSDYDILEDTEISRLKLGRAIFENDNLRKKLESILHPLIKKEIGRFFRYVEKSPSSLINGEKIAFVSVPLLFEAGFDNIFDKIILVYTDDKIRLERLIKRNNYSLREAENRIKSQISQDEKTSLADFVIYNDKSLNELSEKLNKVIELL